MTRKAKRHKRTAQWLGAVLLAALAAPAAAQETALRQLDARLFPIPEELVPNVLFWTQVYTGYDSDHVLLHDERYLSVVYAVLDFSRLEASQASESRKRQLRRQEIRSAEAKYRTILQNLAAGRESKDHPEDQARVARLFEPVPGDRSKYSSAIRRLRTQTCLQDRFAEGVERSGLYMEKFEAAFAKHSLPKELVRMAFVESLFVTRAHSSASAAGIWQFVRSTARYYLDMELEYDERFDPWRATDAAARLLKANYADLGTWPLAITAYNHGSNGMKRAVRTQKTRDLGTIVEKYRSRTFGFASRNFYAEFLAAATIYENRDHYFPRSQPLPALEFDLFVPPSYVSAKGLAKRASIPLDDLKKVNPGFVYDVWADNLYLPKGYPLRVPKGRAAAFQAAYDQLPDNAVASHQVGLHYRVRNGDTLGVIAARFGTSVGALQRANNLRSPHRIRKGQLLLIPPGRGGASGRTIAAASGAPATHVVGKGETLSSIAKRHGTSVSAILAANNLRNADRIGVGQRIKVPAASRGTHVVRSGETLSSIAKRYGTSVRALQSANRIRGSLIRPSQVLLIP